MSFMDRRQTAISCAISARFFAGLIFLPVLSGCLTYTPINANDPHVFLPSVRVSASLDNDKQAVSEPQTGKAIEFEYVRAKGHGEQSLSAGQAPVYYSGATFTPPQQLKNDFSINYADVSFRWRKFFGERSLALELTGGAGYTSMDLSVASPTQYASDRFGNNGPQGGVAMIWRMRPGTSLHVRLSRFVSLADTGIKDMVRHELFVAQALGDNLAVRAGYAKWEIDGDAGTNESNFKSIFSGPMLDLGWNF